MRRLCKLLNAAALGAALLCLPGLSGSAVALTAREVTGKMSPDQKSGYLAGLADMTVFQAGLAGDKTRAQCIYDAFYKNIGKQADAWQRLDEALLEFPDKRAESILFLLVQKMCGGS
jgi:hypothetical protein